MKSFGIIQTLVKSGFAKIYLLLKFFLKDVKYMKLTNLFKRDSRSKISLCGKLEYIIGNYFLSGSGGCSHEIETLYYDSTVKSHDSFLLSKDKVIA